MTQALRKSKGCWGAPQPLHIIRDLTGCVISFSTCIGNLARDTWYYWIDIHAAFLRGTMPFPGTIQEQPNKVLEVFRTIDSYRAGAEAARRKEQSEREQMARMRGSRG